MEIIKTFPIELVPADYDLTFAAALTIQKKGTLITGDPEFRSLVKEKDFKVHFINR